MRILLVEDEAKLAQALRRRLAHDGHWVDLADNGTTALDLACGQDYAAILLDLMLPGADGLTVCRRLRARSHWTPILILTARDDVRDRICGLDAGADDYLVKPFVYAELLARLRAILRRGTTARPTVLTVDDVVVDPAARTVTRAGRPIPLSVREFNLLEFLLRHRGTVVDRARLARHVWGHDHDPRSNVADVYIGYLRRKLNDQSEGKPFIRTVRGVGYQVGDS